MPTGLRMMTTEEFQAFKGPDYRWTLTISPGVWLHCEARPGAWVRLWQWVLLGWTWEPMFKE